MLIAPIDRIHTSVFHLSLDRSISSFVWFADQVHGDGDSRKWRTPVSLHSSCFSVFHIQVVCIVTCVSGLRIHNYNQWRDNYRSWLVSFHMIRITDKFKYFTLHWDMHWMRLKRHVLTCRNASRADASQRVTLIVWLEQTSLCIYRWWLLNLSLLLLIRCCYIL